MASNSPIPIARKTSGGTFSHLATIVFTSSNTKLEIEDIEEGTHEFDIPTSGLLSFEVSTEPEEGGSGTDYFITETEGAPGLETGVLELREDTLSLSVSLEGKAASGEASLKLIGQDEYDIMRGVAEVNLVDQAGLGFQRTANSIILKVFIPVGE